MPLDPLFLKQLEIGAAVGLPLLPVLWLRRRRKRRRLAQHKDVLFQWTPNDPFRVQDLLDGGVLCLGRSGSGKTSSSGRVMAREIIANRNSCGLITAAKPEDVHFFQRLFAQAKRTDDLIVFDSKGEARCNFVNEALSHGGGSREVTRLITLVGETLRSSDNKGGGEMGDFWEREQERMILNAVEIVRLATGKISVPDLQEFISTAATSPAQIRERGWQQGFHYRCLEAAAKAQKTAIAGHDHQLAERYWMGEIPSMAERTRSSISTGVQGILHVFNTGQVRELVSTTTNVSPADMLERRKWVLVNFPPARYGDMGNLINAGWKYLTQRAVLRREANAGDPFNVIWCDEAQQFVNSFDSHYLAQCRSHRGCMVYLTQSLHSIYSALKGEHGKHQTQALLANFKTRIFHALGDHETAEWASRLLGQRLETFTSGSMQPAQDIFDDLIGRSQFTGSFSTKYEPVLQTAVFLNGLRTGGAKNGFVCDAIVMRSGEPFTNGENFLSVAFSQR